MSLDALTRGRRRRAYFAQFSGIGTSAVQILWPDRSRVCIIWGTPSQAVKLGIDSTVTTTFGIPFPTNTQPSFPWRVEDLGSVVTGSLWVVSGSSSITWGAIIIQDPDLSDQET